MYKLLKNQLETIYIQGRYVLGYFADYQLFVFVCASIILYLPIFSLQHPFRCLIIVLLL